MTGRDHALRVFERAVEEWWALAAMLDAAVFNDTIFGFHAHQVAEKALKAWLSALDLEYPPTRDLGRLLSLLEENGHWVAPFDCLIELDLFAAHLLEEAYADLGEPIARARIVESLEVLLADVRFVLGLA
ncbi:MAG: HEPN domain-containing protein [Thermoleophilia bacterium]|nr:HEPN domain-containing protein [Thermoleophilia bacterium]